MENTKPWKLLSYNLLDPVNGMYKHDLIISQRGWEAWLTPVYVRICSTISQVSRCTNTTVDETYIRVKSTLRQLKWYITITIIIIFLKRTILSRNDYSKLIHTRTHTHTHARTHARMHTHTGTRTHKNSDYTKLKIQLWVCPRSRMYDVWYRSVSYTFEFIVVFVRVCVCVCGGRGGCLSVWCFVWVVLVGLCSTCV